MTDHKQCDDHPSSWEGHHLRPTGKEELQKAVGLACDYRGDITLSLRSGEKVVGYVFNRQESSVRPFLELYLPNRVEPRSIAYDEILEVAFSGEDTAFGRSWEDWAKKWKKHEAR